MRHQMGVSGLERILGRFAFLGPFRDHVGLAAVTGWMWMVVAAACLAALVGCGQAPRPSPEKFSAVPASDKPSPTQPAAAVSLRAIDPQGLAAAVASHRGKVVLVDFWATWCEPCKELFPHTVALHRELSSRGLAVLTVSLDDPEDEPQVLAFLASQGAGFENFRAESGASSRSAEAFAIENGTIPYIRLYDREGKLHKAFVPPFASEDVRKAVEDLL